MKTVRIHFDSTVEIGIDAVELVGPSGTAWAKTARASSSYSTARYSSYSRSDERRCLRAELPVAEWSEQWLGYTPFDAILLSSEDLPSMPAGVVDALWRYVECGGNLFVLGEIQVPEPWQSRARTDATNLTQYRVGFGKCLVVRNRNLAKLDTETAKMLQSTADTFARFWKSLPPTSVANAAFPVTKDTSVPVRSLLLIMLGFILVVGPINLFVLSRLKRRIWMLWTVPAISLFTSLLIFVYSLLSEGVTPTVRIESVTLLDQVNRRATTLGAIAYYCPHTPRNGLRFGYETELTPLIEPYSREGTTTFREIDWTQGQHLRRGWVVARVPAHFFVRKSETRRERIQIEVTQRQWAVVNGLGATVRSLWLADPTGRVFFAEAIQPGARAALAPLSNQVSGVLDLGDLLTKATYGALASNLTNNPTTYLRPGTYIAELESNPFLENGLKPNAKIKTMPGANVVYGILDLPGSTTPTARPTAQSLEPTAHPTLSGQEVDSALGTKRGSS